MEIYGDLYDVFRNFGRILNDLIVVADKLYSVQHSKPTFHQIRSILSGEHDFTLTVTTIPQILRNLFCQGTGHGIFRNALLVLVDHATVFTQENAAIRHRCKQLPQAGILSSRRRAKQDPLVMKCPDLVKDLAFQFFFSIL